jgi:hypothetical protein
MKTLKKGLSSLKFSSALFVVIACTFLVATACSVTGPLRADTKATGYRLGTLPPGWSKQNLDSGADVVFFQSRSRSLISVNSVCDRYTDSRLETLTQDLLSPLREVVVLEQEDLKISDRRALYTSVSGKLDGVSVKSHLVVLRKNRCLFDFSLFGTNISETEKSDFLKFAKAFRFEESK